MIFAVILLVVAGLSMGTGIAIGVLIGTASEINHLKEKSDPLNAPDFAPETEKLRKG